MGDDTIIGKSDQPPDGVHRVIGHRIRDGKMTKFDWQMDLLGGMVPQDFLILEERMSNSEPRPDLSSALNLRGRLYVASRPPR